MEMIVVIIILSIILSLSITLLSGAGKDLGTQASAHSVVTFLRNASQFARLEASPVVVVVDTKKRTFNAITQEVFGTWHFEEVPPTGGDAVTYSIRNGGRVPGKLGMGIDMRGNTVVRCTIPKALDKIQGMFVEVWVQPRRGTGTRPIVRIGKTFELGLEPNNLAYVKLDTRKTVSRVPVAPDVWSRLHVVYACGETLLYLNNVEVMRSPGAWALPRETDVQLGDVKAGMIGVVDEFAFGQIVERSPLKLNPAASIEFPSGVTLTDGIYRIAFTPEGVLDPARHRTPVVFTIKSSAEAKEIRVERNGTIQRGTGG